MMPLSLLINPNEHSDPNGFELFRCRNTYQGRAKMKGSEIIEYRVGGQGRNSPKESVRENHDTWTFQSDPVLKYY